MRVLKCHVHRLVSHQHRLQDALSILFGTRLLLDVLVDVDLRFLKRLMKVVVK
jgi:hypothetical protein